MKWGAAAVVVAVVVLAVVVAAEGDLIPSIPVNGGVGGRVRFGLLEGGGPALS